MKKLAAFLLIIIIVLTITLQNLGQEADAASKYLKADEFIQMLVTKLDLSVDGTFPEPYIAAAVSAKILMIEDFGNDFTGYINRTDAAVLINRADEYLHGDTMDADLLEVVLKKRISDIEKVAENKREAVAKCFAKGIIKGYSNGSYSQNRKFKGNEKITKTEAKKLIKLVLHPTKRAKISPDGQLIRTTKLPKYAKYYPYILASFPNSYYDWKFDYEGQAFVDPETGERTPFKKLVDYASPADIDKIKDFANFKEIKKQYLNIWVDKAKTYMECVFNADYRTIDNEWVNKILSTDYKGNDEFYKKNVKKEIQKYVIEMKKNKTIVKSSKIAVDGSSLYFSEGSYVLRVYIKYKIISSKVKSGADTATLINENPYGKILYTRYPLVRLNFKLGQWNECYFDVELSWVQKKEPGNIGVYQAFLDELLYEDGKVNK